MLSKEANVSEINLPFSYYVIISFILGLLVGSFLNVVIQRVPRGESIIFPGSHCFECGMSIGPLDNIPLISFVLLSGRCRHCRARISFLYPAVEILTGLLFVAIIFKTGPSWAALFEMAFVCVMLTLIFIDARFFIVPNVITYPAFIFFLAAATVRGGWGEQHASTSELSVMMQASNSEFTTSRAALIGGVLFALAGIGFWLLERFDSILFHKYLEWEEMNKEGVEEPEPRDHLSIFTAMILGLFLAVGWAAAVVIYSPGDQHTFEDAYLGLLEASFGALIGGGLLWFLRAAYFYVRGLEGMGLGDVKMISIIGAFLGWRGVFGVLLLGSILGVAGGAIMAFRSKRGLKTAFPFGVCLGIAALIVLLTF
jgi:leader peptidase (prepilin peptidase) / N-methyltransferase